MEGSRILHGGKGKEGSSRPGFLKRAPSAAPYEDMQARLQGWGITVLRVVTGIVFLMSGGQKLFGLGFSAVAEELVKLQVPLALLTATAATLVEFLGGVALVLGLFTRWVSIPLAIVMAVDILLFHPPSGFFVNNIGYEYALLRLAACVTLVLVGPGKAALSSILLPRG